jgi:enoyl-CoA hydratase/carnithine racemase
MPTVTLEKVRPHVTVIRLNRPERLNAMSIDLCIELKSALEQVAHDNDCRIVVLTGAGRAFCSGLEWALDIAEGMCQFSPYGVQKTKQVIWANLENTSLAAAIELEDRNQIMLGMTDNLPEAITAFDEGRQPVYTDEPRRGVYSSR